jgi:hypothetical protein
VTDLSLNCGAASDVGLVRDHNEDRYWVDPAHGAFLVVDGVGGQAAGERAAEIAVSSIPDCLSVHSPVDRRRLVVCRAARRASPPSHRRQQPNLRRPNKIPNSPMACVLTLALVEKSHVTIGHGRFAPLPHRSGNHSQSPATTPRRRNRRRGDLRRGSQSHPRPRVFRDVGSPHSADEDHFIEITGAISEDAAMLLCRWPERSPDLAPHTRDRRTPPATRGQTASTPWTQPTRQAAGTTSPRCSSPGRPRGRGAATRPRLGITRIRPRRRVWSGRVAFLSYGLLLGMLLWAVLRNRG